MFRSAKSDHQRCLFMSSGERNMLSAAIDRLALLFGLADLGAWSYMTLNGGNECQYFFDNPILLLALVLFITWLLKFISCKYLSASSWIRSMYTMVTLSLILAVFASMAFALIVTNKDNDEVILGRWKTEYLMFKPSTWFQKHVLESMYQHGDNPANCASGVCQAFAGLNLSAFEFENMRNQLSPLESGCCRPPRQCCMEYKNATFWQDVPCRFQFPREIGLYTDCYNWKNGHTTLCYACGTCMVGIIATAMKVWRHLAILNICIFMLTIILCCNDCWVSRKKNNVSMKL